MILYLVLKVRIFGIQNGLLSHSFSWEMISMPDLLYTSLLCGMFEVQAPARSQTMHLKLTSDDTAFG